MVSKTNPSKFVVWASRMPLLEEGALSHPCTTEAGMVKVYGAMLVGVTLAIWEPLSVVPLAPAVAHEVPVEAWFQLIWLSFHALLRS